MSRKPRKRSKRTPDLNHRNKVRGVLGAADRKASEFESSDRFLVYREGIRRVLVRARADLDRSNRENFLGWLNGLGKGFGKEFDRAVTFGLIGKFYRSPRLSFDSEIDWLITRLAPYTSKLRDFRRLVAALNVAFWGGRKTDALKVLDTIEDGFSRSIWSIETRLALLQFFDGLEAQKSFLREIKAEFPHGVPAYIAHFSSVRNEDRSTIRLFRDDVVRRIDASRLVPQYKVYLRYKLGDVFSGVDADTYRQRVGKRRRQHFLSLRPVMMS